MQKYTKKKKKINLRLYTLRELYKNLHLHKNPGPNYE
jgi:hypothetical protein